MEKPEISIIIATYNSDKTLRKALDSVINQTFQDWECIVVDGDSKDNTVNIIKEYASKDKRFEYISEVDNGIYDAFNKGWKLAKGEWIYYLGSDDEVISTGLQRLLIKSQDADLIYGDTLIPLKDKEALRYIKSGKVKMGGFCCHQSLIMRKSLITRLKGFDTQYRILADKDLICRALVQSINIRYINTPIAIFSNHGISGTSTRKLKESLQINLKFKSQLSAYGDFILNTLKFYYHKISKR